MSTENIFELPAPPWLEKIESAASARGEALAILKVLEARDVAIS